MYKIFYSNGYLDESIQNISRFLKLVHFEIRNETAIELRAIIRTNEKKDKVKQLILKEVNELEIKRFLNTLTAEESNACIYYSVFAGDIKNGMFLNSKTAVYTNILVADFDDIGEVEIQDILKGFTDLGIFPNVVRSGKGYQFVILLEDACFDKDIVSRFTALLHKKGFPVDTKVKDAARFFRLPNTLNFKYYFKDRVAYPTSWEVYSERRYDAQFIFDVIEYTYEDVQLNIVDDLEHILNEETSINEQIEKEEEIATYDITHLLEINDVKNLPLPIKKMLAGQSEGIRNEVLVYLVYYLTKQTKLPEKTILELLINWGKNCTPSLPRDIILSEYKRLKKYAKIHYSNELRRRFGYIRNKPSTSVIVPASIMLNSKTFNNKSINLYLALLVEKLENPKSNYTFEELMSISGLSRSSCERAKSNLLKKGLLKRVRKKARTDKVKYYLAPYFYSNEQWVRIPLSVANKLIRMKPNQILILLTMMLFNRENEAVAVQDFLADKTGFTQQAISITLKGMVDEGILNISKYRLENNFSTNAYKVQEAIFK